MLEKQEKRRAERIKAEKLPDEIKEFTLERLLGNPVKAFTQDASSSGLCLEIPLSKDEMSALNNLFLKSPENNLELVAKIRYVKQESSDLCRVGVEFVRTSSLSQYQKVLREKKK